MTTMNVQKGKIHSIIDGRKARCVPDNDPGIVTHELVIPFYWRETMGHIRVGESVYYLEDESMGGYVIGRCDGEWDGTIRGSLTVMEDVTGKGVSLAEHTHTDSQNGETTSPK